MSNCCHPSDAFFRETGITEGIFIVQNQDLPAKKAYLCGGQKPVTNKNYMFTINIYLRFALIALCLIGGIALAFAYGFWYAFPFLLTGIVLLLGYIFLGTVQSTAQLVQDMKFVEAEKRINMTRWPNFLYKTNRAFYYMIKGTLAMQRKDNEEAEEWLNKAQTLELPTDNEKAMVLMQLANLHASKSKWNKAKSLVNRIKKLKITEPQLKEQVKQFEKAMNQNRGAMRHQQGMHGRGRKGGGFRRIK